MDFSLSVTRENGRTRWSAESSEIKREHGPVKNFRAAYQMAEQAVDGIAIPILRCWGLFRVGRAVVWELRDRREKREAEE